VFATKLRNFFKRMNVMHCLSFRTSSKYITYASHVAPDGMHYTVPFQNPNPHKLSVMEQPSIIDALWKRLHPLLMGYHNIA